MSIQDLKGFPAFAEFMDRIKQIRDEYQRNKDSENTTVIFRAQGATEALDKVLELPDVMAQESRWDMEEP